MFSLAKIQAFATLLGFAFVVSELSAAPPNAPQLAQQDRDLLDDPPAPPKSNDNAPIPTPPAKNSPSQKPPAEDRLKDFDGEDIGQPGEEQNPLLPIERSMRAAEDRVARDQADAETQRLQQEVVARLDKLIAAAQKRCSGNPRPGKSSNAGRPKTSNGVPNKAGEPGQGPLDGPAAESTERLANRTGNAVPSATAKELQAASWGQLPARLRQQILEGAGDEFLPKYEAQLRKYYQRLVEQDAPPQK